MSTVAVVDRGRIGVMVAVGSALALALNDISVPLTYASGFNPPTVVLLRYLFLIAALLILLPILSKPYRLGEGQGWHALGSGICAAVGTVGLLGAFAFIPVSLTVVILYVFPFLIALANCVHHRQWPGLVDIACPLMALGGIAIAIGDDFGSLDIRGLGLAALAAIGYAASIFWNGIKLRNACGITVTLYIAISGAGVVTLFLLVSDSFQFAPAELAAWASLVCAASFFTVAFIAMFKAIEMAGGATTAMVLNLEPIFVVLLAAMWLGEALTWNRLAGSLLVVAAVVFSEYWRLKRPVMHPAPADSRA